MKRKHFGDALPPVAVQFLQYPYHIDKISAGFRYKDYRAEAHERHKLMTLPADEFIRRFLIHVLPKGFHRIRHYGLFANTGRAANIARLRELLGQVPPPEEKSTVAPVEDAPVLPPCPCCGGRMIVIEIIERGMWPSYQAPRFNVSRIDTS